MTVDHTVEGSSLTWVAVDARFESFSYREKFKVFFPLEKSIDQNPKISVYEDIPRIG